jgi:formate dehydrogenase subunit delta
MAAQINQLIKMANQIALNLGEQSRPDIAITRSADHIGRFWTAAMREQLTDYCREGGEGVSPVVVQALGLEAR